MDGFISFDVIIGRADFVFNSSLLKPSPHDARHHCNSSAFFCANSLFFRSCKLSKFQRSSNFKFQTEFLSFIWCVFENPQYFTGYVGIVATISSACMAPPRVYIKV